jgi:hypothetical protein
MESMQHQQIYRGYDRGPTESHSNVSPLMTKFLHNLFTKHLFTSESRDNFSKRTLTVCSNIFYELFKLKFISVKLISSQEFRLIR